MRTRLILPATSVGLLIAAMIAAVSFSGRSDDAPSSSPLPAQTIDAGEVEIRVTPHHLDRSGAMFRVALDTHSAELDMDLGASSRLVVDGVAWPVAAWDGDGPGGHHREGELRFDPVDPPSGTVRLTLDGFAVPVVVHWQLAR